jgi:K+-transporting ATPase ATPase C chain
MRGQLKPAIVMFIAFTIFTGVIYPLAVTGIAQLIFPRQANGSLILRGDTVIGSELIGQPFTGSGWFWSRPSATGPTPYNGGASTGSNYGPTNPDFLKAVQERVATVRAAHPEQTGPVPVDLVTASGSGLDPHITPAAALYQVQRVARERGIALETLRALVERHIQGRQLGFLGEPRVNVLRLNLALDSLAGGPTAQSAARSP